MLKTIHEKPYIYPALILGIFFLIAVIIGSLFISRIKQGTDTLTTTGSAKMRVTSDMATLRGSISRTVSESELLTGYRLVAADTEKLRTFLAGRELTPEEFTIAPPVANEMYDYRSDGLPAPKRYNVQQTITIQSSEIQKVTSLAENIQSLAASGVIFQSGGVEYSYSKLAEARVQLLGEAVKDAEARGKEIAKAAGSRIGKIRSASSGVVQVLAPNSVDVSDYGSYDTSTLEKDITVTVRATFRVR